MNKALAYAAKETLIYLKSKVIEDNYKTNNGICGLYQLISGRYFIGDLVNLQISWEKWPKYSDDFNYPVRSYTSRNPDSKFWATKYYWNPKTKYGQDRMELLDWLIEQCDIKLKEQI